MSAISKIEWTDRTWNPVTGCDKVSPGCKFCYAEGIAKRLWATQYPPVEIETNGPAGTMTRPRKFTDVFEHDDRLEQPLHWREPSRVFVNSMSDLFHEDVPDAFIDRVFAVMALATTHTFQILTKRPERMHRYFEMLCTEEDGRRSRIIPARLVDAGNALMPRDDIRRVSWNFPAWPLPNVWLGVSCEDQPRADERIPVLLRTPAAVRFISAEPLLGPINLRDLQPMRGKTQTAGGLRPLIHFPEWDAIRGEVVRDRMGFEVPRLDWVIVGGESGPKARPCDVAWVRSIVQQCRSGRVACFVKQLGRHAVASRTTLAAGTGVECEHGVGVCPICDAGNYSLKLKDAKGGDPAEWPRDLRVRESRVHN